MKDQRTERDTTQMELQQKRLDPVSWSACPDPCSNRPLRCRLCRAALENTGVRFPSRPHHANPGQTPSMGGGGLNQTQGRAGALGSGPILRR